MARDYPYVNICRGTVGNVCGIAKEQGIAAGLPCWKQGAKHKCVKVEQRLKSEIENCKGETKQ